MLSPNKVASIAMSKNEKYMATSEGLAAPHSDSCRITLWGMIKKGE